MEQRGLRNGDECAISVRVNKQPLAEIVIQTISKVEVATMLYVDEEDDLIALLEALKVAISAIEWRLQRPRLRKLLEERIAELRRESAEEEGEPPYPDDVDDIPF